MNARGPKRVKLMATAIVVAVVAASACSTSASTNVEPFPATVDWEALATQGGTIAYAFGYGKIAVLRVSAREATLISTADDAGIWEGSVALSPDGSRVAYAAYQYNYPGYRVFVMRTDGTAVQQLPCGGGPRAAHCFSPSWAPDGSEVYYLAGSSGAGTVVGARPDGSGFRVLPFTSRFACAVSPDGRRFALSGTGAVDKLATVPTTEPHRLRIVGPDGVESGPQLPGPATGFQPSWSPDGARIAFTAMNGPNSHSPPCYFDFEIAEVSRGSATTVVHVPFECEKRYLLEAPQITFAPDGTRILFNLWTETTPSQLYIADLDGTALRRVATGGAVGVSWVR